MKLINRMFLLCALSATLAPATSAWASVNPDLPPKQVHGSVVYLSGGTSAAQALAMRSEAANYPLELDFLWGRGAKESPIAVVDWSIKNVAGQALLHASSSGPVVLASVPDGRYMVTARHEGKTLSRTATVRKGTHDTVVMEWPQ
jgi:hypothetical protein